MNNNNNSNNNNNNNNNRSKVLLPWVLAHELWYLFYARLRRYYLRTICFKSFLALSDELNKSSCTVLHSRRNVRKTWTANYKQA